MALHPQVQVYCDEINAIEVPPLEERPLDEVQRRLPRHDHGRAGAGRRRRQGPGPRPSPAPTGRSASASTGPRARTPREPLPVYVNFHGSGYVVLSIETHDGVCRALCKGADCIVVGVNYCKAPENKFPKPTEDALGVGQVGGRQLRRDRRRTRRASRSAAIRPAAASRR